MFFTGYLHIHTNCDFNNIDKITDVSSSKIYTFSDVNAIKKLTIFKQNTILDESKIGSNTSTFELKIDPQKTKKKLKGFFIKTKTGNKLITLNHETKI